MTSVPPPGFSDPDGGPERPERPAGAPARTASGRERWRPWGGFVALLAALLITLFASLITSLVGSAFGASIDDPPAGVNIALTFIQDIVFIGAALYFARLAARPRAQDFGLRAPPLARAIGVLFAVWISFYALSALWIAALSIDEQDDLPEQLGADESTLALGFVIVLVVVMAPVAEEFFFRGYFFGALRNWRGMWPAAIITGLVFGAIHLGSSPAGFTVPLAIFGAGLCILYEKTGSLYPCVALHALNNSIAFGVSQDWTWQIPVTMAGSVVVSIAVTMWIGRELERGRAGKAPAPTAA